MTGVRWTGLRRGVFAAVLMHLPALGCANHPCPTARPLDWSQSYDTVSLTAADAAAEEPFDERMAAVMACGVDPCEDFYTYACGGWQEALFEQQAYRGVGLQELTMLNQMWVRDIITVAETSPGRSIDRRRIADFSRACKSDATRQEGLELVKNILAPLDSVRDLDGFARTLGGLQYFGGAPAQLTVGERPRDRRKILWLWLPTTGLHAYQYADVAVLRRYRQFIQESFVAMGMPRTRARTESKLVVAFEMALARAELASEQRLSQVDVPNVVEVQGVSRGAFNWPTVLEAMGLDPSSPILAGDAVLVGEVLDLWSRPENLPALLAYTRWMVVLANAESLGGELEALHDDFHLRYLAGLGDLEVPREMRCIDTTYSWMRDAIDRFYTEITFSEAQHQLAVSVARNVAGALDARLASNRWLDAPTRRAARAKLRSLDARIGAPSRWRPFPADVTLGPDHAVNVLRLRRAAKIEEYRELDEVLAPRWAPISIANAFYEPRANRITVPAGVLQPPFFGPHLPYVVNMARVGNGVGHELSHAFDNVGRLFNADGHLAPWFTPRSDRAFAERAQCLVDAFDGLSVGRGAQVDGFQTLGENLADLGGINASWDAYRAWLRRHPDEAGPHVDGLTDDQLFFLAFGQTWCTFEIGNLAEMQAETDAHTDNRNRVNVTLANFAPFHEAFACEPGDAMVAEEVCTVW